MVGLPPRFAIPTDVLESYPALALQGVSEFTGVVTIDDPPFKGAVASGF